MRHLQMWADIQIQPSALVAFMKKSTYRKLLVPLSFGTTIKSWQVRADFAGKISKKKITEAKQEFLIQNRFFIF